MKVNTDGVLLGAVVPVCDADCRVLDIGTGTGVIALMLAQRLTADTEQSFRMQPLRILGIDIDPDAAAEAADNFASSEWAEALKRLAWRAWRSGLRGLLLKHSTSLSRILRIMILH